MLRIHGCISKEHRADKWLGLRTGTTRRQEGAEPWLLLSVCRSVYPVAPQPPCHNPQNPQRINNWVHLSPRSGFPGEWPAWPRAAVGNHLALFPQRNGVCAPSLESGPACNGFDRWSVAEVGPCDFWGQVIEDHTCSSSFFAGTFALRVQTCPPRSPSTLRLPRFEEAQVVWKDQVDRPSKSPSFQVILAQVARCVGGEDFRWFQPRPSGWPRDVCLPIWSPCSHGTEGSHCEHITMDFTLCH